MTYATKHTRTLPAKTSNRPALIPPTIPLPNTNQVKNSAGGYTWEISDWDRLDRFLILGSEGGTFYASERKLTKENAAAVQRCILEDGVRVIKKVIEISVAGRAPKNDEAIFVLALCSAAAETETRQAALKALPLVARTGMHMIQFMTTASAFRGRGRAFQRAVSAWYNDKAVEKLAYQLVKYQSRDGWSQRDVLRLARPTPASDNHAAAYRWATKGWSEIGSVEPVDGTKLLWVYECVKRATNEAEIINLIRHHRLTWEFVPGQWLGSAQVWKALLPNLPLGALVRNLGRMSANGTLKPLSQELDMALAMLEDQNRIRGSRLHPLNILLALKTYASGQGQRGNLTWQPNGQIIKALDKAFTLAFGNVLPTGKDIMLALDTSSSMKSAMLGTTDDYAARATKKGKGHQRDPLPISSREASAAMAMITAAVEPRHMFTGFSAGGTNFLSRGGSSYGRRDGISELSITPGQRLDDVIRYIDGLGFGATDPSLPMLYALDRGIAVDTFVVYTDNEVNTGIMHPSAALKHYRTKTGIDAKLVVVAMTSTGFTIADPNDAGMLDVVGFDLSTPTAISCFIGGQHNNDLTVEDSD